MVAGMASGHHLPSARIPWRNTINSRERAPSLSASAINLTRPLCGVVSVCPTAHSSLLLPLLRILGQSKNSSGFWDNAPSSEEEAGGMEERRARLFIIFFLSFFVSTFQCVSYSQGSCIGKNICNHFCPMIAWLQSTSWFVQKAGWPLKMIGAEAHNYPRSKTRWLKGSLSTSVFLFLFCSVACFA